MSATDTDAPKPLTPQEVVIEGPAAEDRLDEMVDAYCKGLGTDDPSFPGLRSTMREGMRAVLKLFYAENSDVTRNAAYYRGRAAQKGSERHKNEKLEEQLLNRIIHWRERARSAEGQLSAQQPPAEPRVPCGCCGGLCAWHALPESEREPFEPIIAADMYDPPGCWGCCGAGCRACKNTGFITLSDATESARKAMVRQRKLYDEARDKFDALDRQLRGEA